MINSKLKSYLKITKIIKMTKYISAIVCTCELENGYIFKNYFNFNSLRGRPIITFTDTKIRAGNCTADNQMYGGAYVHGDEINLLWDSNIAPERRQLSLTLDVARLQNALSKIRKKDTARITIIQVRDASNPHNFDDVDSSDEFTIFVSCGIGGDGREGLKSVPATRDKLENIMIKYPKGYSVNLLIIPIKQFKAMIDAFSKCKKVSILIRFHSNNVKDITGREIKGRPGLVITTEGTSQSGRIFEKFGEVPDEENTQALNPTSSLKIDESSIVRVTNSSYPTFEIEKIPEPNEYIIGADKIEIFSKLSSMHNEGSVRIRYLEGYHLHIAYRFGAFGECEICLYNPHVK